MILTLTTRTDGKALDGHFLLWITKKKIAFDLMTKTFKGHPTT
jgi:hypothetical protein